MSIFFFTGWREEEEQEVFVLFRLVRPPGQRREFVQRLQQARGQHQPQRHIAGHPAVHGKHKKGLPIDRETPPVAED